MSKFTLIADSTQIQAFMECPERWNLAHNENLEIIGSFKKPMNMGSYGHVILENYYKQIALGNPPEKAIDFATSIEPEDRLELLKEEIELIRSKCILYSYTYARNDFVPLNPESVELGFSYKLYEDDRRLFILEGKMDHYHHGASLGFYNGARCITDHKFQMRAHDLYSKKIQFRNYALATRSNLLMINYISMTKKTDEKTFRRQLVPFTSIELDLWEKRLINVYKKMESQIRIASGELTGKPEPFEHNWGSCENHYGYPCAYTAICESTNQFEIDLLKKTKYVKIERWVPWK